MSSLFSRTRPLAGSLLFRCGPPTVIGGVVAVVVDSVKRHSDWTRPHVLQKRLKAIRPSLAHGDSSPGVPLVGMVPWVKAARLRLNPRHIFAALVSHLGRAMTRMAMLQCSRAAKQYLSGAAALTALRPVPQRLGANGLSDTATVAATNPCTVSLDVGWRSTEHFIESESLTWRISNHWVHGTILPRWSPVAWWRYAVVSLIEQPKPKEPK